MDETIAWLVAVGIVAYAIFCIWRMKPADQEEARRRREAFLQHQERQRKIETYGHISPAMICPHCQTKGQVSTKEVKRKKGVSGAKVTGAIFTCGVSLIATGLSRKEGLTQAHCGNCNSTWDF